jgi:hypothetical protein
MSRAGAGSTMAPPADPVGRGVDGDAAVLDSMQTVHISRLVARIRRGNRQEDGTGPLLRPGADRGRVEAAHRRSGRRRGGGGDGGLGLA